MAPQSVTGVSEWDGMGLVVYLLILGWRSDIIYTLFAWLSSSTMDEIDDAPGAKSGVSTSFSRMTSVLCYLASVVDGYMSTWLSMRLFQEIRVFSFYIRSSLFNSHKNGELSPRYKQLQTKPEHGITPRGLCDVRYFLTARTYPIDSGHGA
ncbi:hypothetical protein VUR80DRAFT_2675 [Thermomyces stellatus]